MLEEGEGKVVYANPPPPNPPTTLTLPQCLLKTLGPTSGAARKATLVPWSAEALQEGCARDRAVPNSPAWRKKGHVAAGQRARGRQELAPAPRQASERSAGGH